MGAKFFNTAALIHRNTLAFSINFQFAQIVFNTVNSQSRRTYNMQLWEVNPWVRVMNVSNEIPDDGSIPFFTVEFRLENTLCRT